MSTTPLNDAITRARGKQGALEFIHGVKLAAGGWPREFATTTEARRGFDRMAARLERSEA